jgi:hypothetical protein
MESILTSIKKLLGVEESYEHFDADIIMHINSVFMILTQLGVGPSEGFIIEDKTATWSDFLSDTDLVNLSAVKTFVHLKVRLIFDPPSGTVAESMNKLISELEWRMFVNVDNKRIDEEGIQNG